MVPAPSQVSRFSLSSTRNAFGLGPRSLGRGRGRSRCLLDQFDAAPSRRIRSIFVALALAPAITVTPMPRARPL